MSEAWMQRGYERQEFQSQIEFEISVLDDTAEIWSQNRARACAYLGKLIIDELLGVAPTPSGSKAPIYENIARSFFARSILPRYKEFARAEEEKNAMLAELAVWLIQMRALSRFQQALSHKEIFEPQVIFHAPSAMHEVEPTTNP